MGHAHAPISSQHFFDTHNYFPTLFDNAFANTHRILNARMLTFPLLSSNRLTDAKNFAFTLARYFVKELRTNWKQNQPNEVNSKTVSIPYAHIYTCPCVAFFFCAYCFSLLLFYFIVYVAILSAYFARYSALDFTSTDT